MRISNTLWHGLQTVPQTRPKVSHEWLPPPQIRLTAGGDIRSPGWRGQETAPQ